MARKSINKIFNNEQSSHSLWRGLGGGTIAALKHSRSHAFNLGGGYKQHLYWVLPMSGFNNVLAILVYRTRSLFEPDFVMPEEKSLRSLSSLNQYCQTDKKEILSCHTAWGKCKDAQSQGLVADIHKRCNELHPTKLEGMQTISPSPLHRERIECPATKGAEDILGEGLSVGKRRYKPFTSILGYPIQSTERSVKNA